MRLMAVAVCSNTQPKRDYSPTGDSITFYQSYDWLLYQETIMSWLAEGTQDSLLKKKIQLLYILLCVLGVCTDAAATGTAETATGYLVIRANVCLLLFIHTTITMTGPSPCVIYLPRAGWILFIIKFIFILVYKETKFKTFWIVINAACNGGVQQTASLLALSVFSHWCIYIYIYLRIHLHLHIQVHFRRRSCHLVQEAPQPIINNQYVNSPAL